MDNSSNVTPASSVVVPTEPSMAKLSPISSGLPAGGEVRERAMAEPSLLAEGPIIISAGPPMGKSVSKVLLYSPETGKPVFPEIILRFVGNLVSCLPGNLLNKVKSVVSLLHQELFGGFYMGENY